MPIVLGEMAKATCVQREPSDKVCETADAPAGFKSDMKSETFFFPHVKKRDTAGLELIHTYSTSLAHICEVQSAIIVLLHANCTSRSY